MSDGADVRPMFGDWSVDPEIPDGMISGNGHAFAVLCNVEVVGGKVVGVRPIVDYHFYLSRRGDKSAICLLSRCIEDREKYPNWPNPETETKVT